jgi:hypothetical protein
MTPYRTLRATSDELGISLNTLRTYAASGKIQVLKIDGTRYITQDVYNKLAQDRNIQVYTDDYIQVYIPTPTGLVSKLVKSSDCKVPDWRIVTPIRGFDAIV